MKVNKLVLTLLAAGMGVGLVSGAHAATDAERMAALEKQLQMLQKELADLKADAAVTKKEAATKKEVADLNDQVVLQGKESVVGGDLPNSFRMPGSETSVHIYGYGEINLIHDFESSVPGDYFTYTQFQPLRSTNPSKGNMRLTAQTSRIGIETQTPTPIGPFNTKIEADFYGNAAGPSADANGLTNNSAMFRLRHVYGEYAGFLIGQTWSTFMDGDNLPETVDFNGPPGATFTRPVQIRYTYNKPDVAKFQIAVENPTTGSASVTGARGQAPSLVLRADKTFASGVLSVRAIRHVEIDSASGNSAVGYGYGVSGSYKLTEDLTGFAQYTRADSDSFTSLVVGSNAPTMIGNDLTMDRTHGVVLGLTNVFNPQWRATLAYGRAESRWDDTSDYALSSAGMNKSVSQWHLNVYYTPIKNIDLGLELIKGTRTTFTNDYGDLSRVNLQARYTFN